MQNEKKMTKYIKYDYVINELIDDMKKSIDNVNTIILAQEELVVCLEKESNSKFTDFITHLKNTTEQYKMQLKILEHRLDCADKVKQIVASTKDESFMLAMLLETFGIANKEAKTLEERIENKEEVAEIAI